MNTLFIIIYLDGSLTLYANRQKSESHQKLCKLFEAPEDTTLRELSDWLNSDGLNVSRIHSTAWA